MTPYLVLVHGAWHGNWCWDLLRPALGEMGIASEAVSLPGPARRPGRHDLYAQARWLSGLVATIPRPVILVGHSYGGQVVSEASADLDNVVGLVYLAAFLGTAGESCRDLNESGPIVARSPAIPTRVDGEDLLALDPTIAAADFYDECSPAVTSWACARLTPEAPMTVRAPLTREGWRSHPTRYITCARDRVLHPSIQARLALRADSATSLQTGHSPMLSAPAELAAELADLSWLGRSGTDGRAGATRLSAGTVP